jgi:hypothetical protein
MGRHKDAFISGLSAFLPYAGDLAKLGKIRKDINLIADTINAGKAVNTARTGFKNFTRRYFASNLEVLTGEAANGRHAHHMLPVQFESEFSLAGANIHDPKYGAWLEPHLHLSIRKNMYNSAWEAFFKDNPNPSISDIEKHM